MRLVAAATPGHEDHGMEQVSTPSIVHRLAYDDVIIALN